MGHHLETFWQDLRFGVRMLLKYPGFTFVAVLTLALGIGANTAIFSVVNAVFLRPLPYHNADELMMFHFTDARGREELVYSPAAYLDLKSQNSVFTDVAAWGNNTWPANLTGDGEPERLQGFQVSANFFQVLGVAAVRGRTFLPEEDHLGSNRVVISYDLWQRKFGGDPEMIGHSIQLNGVPYDCIGVMPAEFRFVLKTDVWTTLDITVTEGDDHNIIALNQVARLKPDVSIERACIEIENLLRPYINDSNRDKRATLKPLQAVLMEDVHETLFILFAAVSFVLLIACVNIANLLIARASARRKELAIRAALGAGRLRVVRQLLVESSLLAIFGGACGLILANWCIKFLVAGLPIWVAAKNSHVAMLKLDGWAFSYTFVLALATTIIFGLVPAIQASKVDLNEALKEGSRSDTQGRRQNRLFSLLVVTEVALTVVLLAGAGLMIKSFWRLTNANRGFEQEGVLTARIDPLSDRYGNFDQVVAFYQQLLERISAIPGVEYAGITNGFLDRGWKVVVEEHPSIPEDERSVAARHPVSLDYFRAMSIPLRAGRFFTDRDVNGGQPVAIIDETLQRRYFPNENPIGKHLRFEDTSREIVGVVGATKAWKDYSYGADKNLFFPHVYLPYQQENWETMAIIVRVPSGDPMSLIPAIRREVAAIDKDQPIYSFKLLEQSVAELSSDRRFSTFLLSAFAAMAAILATIGIYGVMSYAVAQRIYEIGIRVALGAQAGDVLKLVIRQGMTLVGVGLFIGLLGAFVLTRFIAAQLYDVSAVDPVTFALISLLFTGVAMLACYLPARQATKVDPLVAIRH
jgi:putative ABC transport system permease protein